MANTLRVNLSAVGNACDQDSTPAGVWPHPGWYAFLNTCDGKPYVKAGKEYGPFAIDHGYVEIKDVPPGKYLLFAIVNPFPVTVATPGALEIFQSNFASHYAVVEVCECCEDVCVTLYNSGWHYCVQVIIYWFELLILQGQMDERAGRAAIDALGAARKQGGDTKPGDAAANAALQRHTETFLGWHREQSKSRK